MLQDLKEQETETVDAVGDENERNVKGEQKLREENRVEGMKTHRKSLEFSEKENENFQRDNGREL